MTPLEWLMAGDTGISSKTILSVLEDTPPPRSGVDVPHDAADFGRCHRLLGAFPDYRARLHEVAEKYPAWVGLVREWDWLATMYEAKSPSLYDVMRLLIHEGMRADGWVQAGPGSCCEGENVAVGLGGGFSVRC